jgi:hypothetical protein
MLRITVELVPLGDESRKRVLNTMVIANVNPGQFSDYEGWTSADDWAGDPEMFGMVKNHDRRKSVWELIASMYNNMVNKRQIPDPDPNSVSQRLRHRLRPMKNYPLSLENIGGDVYTLMSRGHHSAFQFMNEVRQSYEDWPMGHPEWVYLKAVPTRKDGYKCLYVEVPAGTKGCFPATVTTEASGEELYWKEKW